MSALLSEPIELAGIALPNRVVMAPMTRTRADEDGTPNDLMREYYVQRASAGLIVTECTQVSPQGHGIIRCPGIHTDRQVEGWRRVVDGVHDAGGRIFLQLWHCGRISHPDLLGGDLPVGPSAVAAEGKFFLPEGRVDFPTPRALETAEIAPIIEDFVRAAGSAKHAGFDGVELHGAFGYLPDQFLQSGTNHRTDGYGGSGANRARFMVEVVEALTGVWGPDRVGCKLSPSNRFYGMFDADAASTFGHLIGEFERLRVGYLHMMEPNDADRGSGTVQIEHVVEWARPLSRRPIIANGGFDAGKAEAALASGACDAVSFGVPFIANPDLPERLERGFALSPPDPSTFYGIGPGGYVDYPVASEASHAA